MNIKLVALMTLKTVGLLFAFGCWSTMQLSYSYPFVTNWWKRTSGFALTQRDVEEMDVSVEQQQQQRQRRLREACLLYNDTWQDPGRTFIVSHDLRLVFCVVGKAACTSWLRVLLQMTGNPDAQEVAATDRTSVHAMFGFYLKPVSFHNVSELSRPPLRDYYKFMFVREPLERLVSAYRDKMFRASEYVPLRQYIISRFRRHPSLRSLQTEESVKFEEFVQHVLREAHGGLHQLDHHWRPQNHLCQPCHIDYDFIGHYETLHRDSEYVLRQISRRLATPHSARVQFPATDLDSRNRNSREFLWKFYHNLSTHNVLRLQQLYKKDGKIFDYGIPDVIRRKLKILTE